MLDAFCHTLVIVLIDGALNAGDDPLWNWIEACWGQVRASDGRHAAIGLPFDERTRDAFVKKRPGMDALQLKAAHEFGEPAIRPAMVALFALHQARLLLARGLSASVSTAEDTARLRLFISHAKMDALPLAQALRHQNQSTHLARALLRRNRHSCGFGLEARARARRRLVAHRHAADGRVRRTALVSGGGALVGRVRHSRRAGGCPDHSELPRGHAAVRSRTNRSHPGRQSRTRAVSRGEGKCQVPPVQATR